VLALRSSAPTWLIMSHASPVSSVDEPCGHVLPGSGFAIESPAYRTGSNVRIVASTTGLIEMPTYTSPRLMK
jgi:hypothetical protein